MCVSRARHEHKQIHQNSRINRALRVRRFRLPRAHCFCASHARLVAFRCPTRDPQRVAASARPVTALLSSRIVGVLFPVAYFGYSLSSVLLCEAPPGWENPLRSLARSVVSRRFAVVVLYLQKPSAGVFKFERAEYNKEDSVLLVEKHN